MGRSIIAEFRHKGKKKECVLQCALEACRILDRHGVLRQSHHGKYFSVFPIESKANFLNVDTSEPQRKRRKESSSEDDDDEFYDRTRGAEEKRKQKDEKKSDSAMTYEQLLDEEKTLIDKIVLVEAQIAKYQEMEKTAKQNQEIEDNDGDLDDFMSTLQPEKALDKTDIKRYRVSRAIYSYLTKSTFSNKKFLSV